MNPSEISTVRHRCRGRPRVSRHLDTSHQPRCYAPQCMPSGEEAVIPLLPEEVEILRLVDLEGLEQEEAAARLGVSRKTAWRDLHSARRKVAGALVYGRVLEVAGCARKQEGSCPRWNLGICPKKEGGTCPRGYFSPETGETEFPGDAE